MLVRGPACRLWVEVLGRGAPVTLFAHGITSSVAELEPLAARTPGTRVFCELPGHGRSDVPADDAPYRLEGLGLHLSAVADRFGASRAFGVSASADALLGLVAADPARFERLALFLPTALAEPPPRDPGPLAAWLGSEPLARVAERAVAAPEYQPLFDARPAWRERVRDRVMRMNADGVPRALRGYAASAAPVPRPEALALVSAPVLVLAHEGDPVHRAGVARAIAALLPRATLRVWPEPLAMYDDLDAFAALIADFLAG